MPGSSFVTTTSDQATSNRASSTGRERPACILVTLAAGERLTGVSVVAEDGVALGGDFVARNGDVVIVPIQSDPPGAVQLGVVLDVQTKRYVGLPDDGPSYAIVSEVNVDAWPNGGIRDVPGRQGTFAYARTLPGPKLAEIAKTFRKLRERNLVTGIVRHP